MASFDVGNKQTRAKPQVARTSFGSYSGFVLRWGALSLHMDDAELHVLVRALSDAAAETGEG